MKLKSVKNMLLILFINSNALETIVKNNLENIKNERTKKSKKKLNKNNDRNDRNNKNLRKKIKNNLIIFV